MVSNAASISCFYSQQKIPSEDETTTEESNKVPPTSSSVIPENPTYPKITERNSYAEVAPKTDSVSSKKSDLPIKVPDVSSLRHPLKIARAFRPLMQYISYGKADLLDEEATVENIAELEGICVPILKSPLELQFDLALVVDRSDSMIFGDKQLKNYNNCSNVMVFFGMYKLGEW